MTKKKDTPEVEYVNLADLAHPLQPIGYDEHGVIRFKANPIVRFLIDWATPRGIDMNALAVMPWDDADRAHFAQLIGYSVSGWGDLSYVQRDPTLLAEADRRAEAVVKAAGGTS